MPNTIKTVPYPYTLTEVSYNLLLSVRCGGIYYQGPVHISYVPNGKLLDFESMRDCINSIAQIDAPVEDVARTIFDALRVALGNAAPLRVMVEITNATLGTACITIIDAEEEARG